MLPVNMQGTAALQRILTRYAAKSTIARVAGMLTNPRLQANSARLEILVHQAVALCNGKERAECAEISKWLNHHLGKTDAASWEDPPEDVFVTNIETPEGNFLLIDGLWEGADFHLQAILNILFSRQTPAGLRKTLRPILALLKLSNLAATRVGLERWCSTESDAKGRIMLDGKVDLRSRARAVTFSNEEIADLGLSKNDLEPFIFIDEAKPSLLQHSAGSSALVDRPLIEFDDSLILALPTAVSPAIRKYVMGQAKEKDLLTALGYSVSRTNALMLREYLSEFNEDSEAVQVNVPKAETLPGFSDWLIRYDAGHFLHIVLLEDDIEKTQKNGFEDFSKLSTEAEAALGRYISEVADAQKTHVDFIDGTTFIVSGGMGRGSIIGFERWPENWGLACISMHDLKLLAIDKEKPIRRFIKCLRYQDQIQAAGVRYFNINGDFNFYSYLCESGYEYVPRQVPMLPGTTIIVAHDYVRAVRQAAAATRRSTRS